MSLADWQQMMTTPTHLHNLDFESSKLQQDTSVTQILHFINEHYPDPDYGFDPYWEVHSNTRHHLFFFTIV